MKDLYHATDIDLLIGFTLEDVEIIFLVFSPNWVSWRAS